jgi:hypothetical protein
MDQHEGFVIEPIVNKRCANFNVLNMVLNKPHECGTIVSTSTFSTKTKRTSTYNMSWRMGGMSSYYFMLMTCSLFVMMKCRYIKWRCNMQLKQTFEMIDLGDMKFYLGAKITYWKERIFICQWIYISILLFKASRW